MCNGYRLDENAFDVEEELLDMFVGMCFHIFVSWVELKKIKCDGGSHSYALQARATPAVPIVKPMPAPVYRAYQPKESPSPALYICEEMARQLLTLYRPHSGANAAILSGIPEDNRKSYGEAWFHHAGQEGIWEKQFGPRTLIGLSCAAAPGDAGYSIMLPAIDYRLPPSAAVPDATEKHAEAKAAYQAHLRIAAAREKGLPLPEPLVVNDSAALKLDTHFAAAIPEPEAKLLRDGVKRRKTKTARIGGSGSDDLDDLLIEELTMAPPPEGWCWHNCGGTMPTAEEVLRAMGYVQKCKDDGVQFPALANNDPQPNALNDCQHDAYDLLDLATDPGGAAVEHGSLTHGPAGTGKSRFAEELLAMLGKKHGGENVLVGAPTGCAAQVLSGATLHYLFHISHSSTATVSVNVGSAHDQVRALSP